MISRLFTKTGSVRYFALITTTTVVAFVIAELSIFFSRTSSVSVSSSLVMLTVVTMMAIALIINALRLWNEIKSTIKSYWLRYQSKPLDVIHFKPQLQMTLIQEERLPVYINNIKLQVIRC
ncbi:MAG: hypothetical protein JXL85_05955 [Bacilli bacterium]|nr:hypothetical protein [Bacilli bacterium]